MRVKDMKSVIMKTALAAMVLLSASATALAAQVVNLTAAPTSTTLSDGNAVPMWGYTCGAAVTSSTATCAALNPTVAAGAWSPVVITVPSGQALEIDLTNNLVFANGNSVPTSLVIVGQLGGGLGTGATGTPSPDHSAVRAQTWPTTSSGTIVPPPAQGNRVQSFATEVPAGAVGTATAAKLTWSNLQPGTYLIESGTHPSIQAPMGLYGILVVTDASTGTAYPKVGTTSAVTYNADVALLFSEIDPVQNNAVSAAVNTAGFSETLVWSGLVGGCGNPASASYQTCYPPAVNYSPLYYLINGRTFDTTNAVASLFPFKAAATATCTPVAPATTCTPTVLVRFANAGLKMHVPAIVGSQTTFTAIPAPGVAATTKTTAGLTLVAEDGNVLPGKARVQNEVFLAAGKTYDVLINTPASTASLPVYDRELSLSANATGRNGGMLAYIGASGSALPPAAAVGSSLATAAATNDTYNAVVAGQALTVSDPAKGLIANDVNVYGVSLLTAPTAGTVKLNRNGTFTYTPTVAAGTTFNGDSFTYCANAAFTPATATALASCSSAALTATVTLGASTVLAGDSGVTCNAATFTSTVSTYYASKTPGVLAGCKDGANLPISLDPSKIVAPSGVTVMADSNGGFTAKASAPGTYTFTFVAKNSLGKTSAPINASVTFPTPSNLAVTVLDGSNHTTQINDYRWIIEEDRTFYVDPACITNPLPAGCPTIGGGVTSPINYGTQFHTAFMPVIASGCTGALSCESGQTLQGVATVCDVGNGACRTTDTQQAISLPSSVALDPSKRYYISVLPGDSATPFIAGYTGVSDCSAAGVAAGHCGHGMGGAPIAAACGPQSPLNTITNSKVACPAAIGPVTVYAVPTPLPSSTLSVLVYQDDYPLNGEQGSGGGVDVLAPQEAGLGGFQITIYDQAGQTGAATGTPAYDMSNQPLANALAGTHDPVSGLDACPISVTASTNAAANADPNNAGSAPLSTSTGLIVTCPTFESDGKTLSPLVGQALIKNLYPGRYGVAALPGASRIALGEEWLQTNTLDGQKAHDSFMRVGEPGYFQEFGPAGYHVSIGMANPKIINDRRTNAAGSGMCDATPKGSGLNCGYGVTGQVTGARLSRAPDSRLYSSGSRASLSFTQCYVSLGDPDGAEIAFTKCDDQGHFTFSKVPAGNWKITTFDQWNDQIIDGITQPVSVGCANNVGGLCTTTAGPTNVGNTTCTGPATSANFCDMGEIGVHQWQADIYTRTFIDTTGTGLSNDVDPSSAKAGTAGINKPGLALASTNVRFRDGSFSDFNNTDLNGYAPFNEEFPLFNWYTIETDSTRYKTTGVHVIYDAGGPADGSASCGVATTNGAPSSAPLCGGSTIAAGLANTYENFPLPADLSLPGAVYCTNADCFGQSIAKGPVLSGANSTGRIDPPYWFGSYGWQGYIGQGNFLEFGKKPFAANETGPIHGHVVYSSTRPFDNPQMLLQAKWEPLVAHVTVNLYQEGVAADGVTQTLKLVDTTTTTSWDDWVQGFDAKGKPYMSCPGQQGGTDPFFYALQNQPQFLDWYNAQHNGGTQHTIPHNSQFKCYDGEHTWNQLQPAPYDGIYSFPSVTSLDPSTGKPAGTNCTACIANPDTTDPYRVGTPMLPAGKYVVEVVVPPGYELVKEEDKNILIGDNFIAPAAVEFPGLASAVYILPDQAALSAVYNPLNPQNSTADLGRNLALSSHEGDTGSVETYWPCVGEVRQVPDYISLYPQSKQVAPFAGAFRPLCDRKEVTLDLQTAALAKFYVFTSTHVSSHFQGIILDDFAAEFDPFSPQFSEKFAPSYLPVAVKDWTGNNINRVYSDQFGLYNGLNYSTWDVNPPNPTGYAPTMMVMCMNDAGQFKDANGNPVNDPLFQPGYSQFCYELPFMPGQTGYFDTPVVPVQAFSSGSYNRPDCAYPDATPAIASVTGSDGVAGPWVKATGSTLTITAAGDQSVDWYGYTGPAITDVRFNKAKITRHYGFGGTQGTGTVMIGGAKATVTAWSDTQITVTVPAGVPACAVQQQGQYGGSAASCGQLIVTTATGKQSVDTVTVTVGGKKPTVVPAGSTIQAAIDGAAPGDLIIVPPGLYNEMLVMWKPVRLQGVGAIASIIDANTQPAGKLLNPWRQKIVCMFGLTTDGRPDTSTGRTCTTGLNYVGSSEPAGTGFMNFPNMIVDRIPLEATLGWDASLNGNLGEQLIEPSLMGAYEGAAITVLGKGVKFPTNTAILDAFGALAATPAAFPTGTVLLSSADCGAGYPSNFYCNPSSIDGLGIRNSSQGGGGIFVHAYAHNLQIANNRIHNNQGTMSGGVTVGVAEHPDVAVAGTAILDYPGSCETSTIANQQLPFCFNKNVNVHHNAVVANSSLGDEVFSSTPAGAGGVSINTGADYYHFTNNWVCGNLSSGDGGGVSHIGFSKNGDIERNTIIFNQSTNPSITTNGGGLLVMGAPDADPITCGVASDLDCVPTPAEILPSAGTGPGLTINANLILGNAADSGSGGGLRIQHVNGTDVLNLPNGAVNCTADLGRGSNTKTSYCYWNSVNVTNNIIVNNVAGWDGAGVSLLDTLAANIVNNTIASNDATASSGTLFQALFAPLASSAAPKTGVICGATAGQSCPQVAGLVSVSNSPVLQANIGLLPANTPLTCPAGHGVAVTGGQPSCFYNSIPVLANDAIWQNRSFYIGVGGFGSVTATSTLPANTNLQHVVSLYNAPQGTATTGTTAANQTATGGCPAGSTYWDLGFRGDTTPSAHVSSGFQPFYSVISSASATTYGPAANKNSTASPTFTSQYCNGSRIPPEITGGSGYAVPPGVNEFNAFPNPVFTLTSSGVVDEGNNWVNVRWGPLALTNPATGAVLGNYVPATGSSAIDTGAASVNFGTAAKPMLVLAPATDIFGNVRPSGKGYDVGAVEVGGATPAPILTVTGGPLSFSGAVGYTTAAQTLTVHNTGNAATTVNPALLVFTSPVFSQPAGAAGGTCSNTTALLAGGTCTINVVFAPTAVATVTGTLTISADVAVAGSPVSLTGAGAAAVTAATLTPTTWSPSSTRNCPGTGLGQLACLLDPAQTFTLKNTGNIPLTGIGNGVLAGTNVADYTVVSTLSTCGPLATGQLVSQTTLAPGGTCVVTVQFKPLTKEAAGAKAATISVTDGAGTQTSTISGIAK